MKLSVKGLDWDDGNLLKCQSHDVSIADIEHALRSELIVIDDHRHSFLERRLIAIGRTASDRPIFIGFTFRERGGDVLVRPFTARFMGRKELKRYEKAHS